MAIPAVLRSLATLLASNNVGTYTVGSIATAGALPVIVMKQMPTAPDKAIVLNMVIQSTSRDVDGPSTYSDVMIQVRSRGGRNDPLDVDDIAESVSLVLDGLTQYAVGSYTIISLKRMTHIQNGMDSLNRSEVISQFYGQIATH